MEKESICMICQEFCEGIPRDQQMNMCFHKWSGLPLPCCGQNGTDPPFVHLSCFMKAVSYAREHCQVLRCPLCRVDLEPFLNQERSFHELKK